MSRDHRHDPFAVDIAPPKDRRNPLVIVGALATAGVLVGGLAAFKKGNTNVSQAMMRTRVVFQGVTVAIMLGTSGYVYSDDKK